MEHALNLPLAVRIKAVHVKAGAQVAPDNCWWSSSPHECVHPAITAEHEAFRETVRRFVAQEIVPHAAAWDEAGEFPRELYRKAAAAGLLGIGFPEEYGGTPADLFTHVHPRRGVRAGRRRRRACRPLLAQIGAPPIAAAGSEELKRACCRRSSRARRSARSPSPSRAAARTWRACGPRRGRRRRVRRQRREDLHHLGHARRLLHRRGAHRRRRRVGRVAAAHRARPPRLHAHGAEEDGLVVLRHRDPAFRQCARAGREPDRRGERGLSRHHAQLQFRAARHGRGRGGLRAGLPGRRAGLGARAQDLRQAAARAPGDPPQAGGHAGARPCRARPALRHAWKLDAGAARAGVHRAAGDAQERRHPRDAVLRRRRGADAGRRGLHARHARRAHLSRGEGDAIGGGARRS